jgi:3-hydroxyacyl-[acyl-carrier-protein] dehydratase
MLQGDFFTILSTEWNGPDTDPEGKGSLAARVSLDPGHVIYKGHFPGRPVVPGVCEIQMVRETLEKVLGVKTRLASADQVKFLRHIVPAEHPELEIRCQVKRIAHSDLEFIASIWDMDTVFLKMKGTLCSKLS